MPVPETVNRLGKLNLQSHVPSPLIHFQDVATVDPLTGEYEVMETIHAGGYKRMTRHIFVHKHSAGFDECCRLLEQCLLLGRRNMVKQIDHTDDVEAPTRPRPHDVEVQESQLGRQSESSRLVDHLRGGNDRGPRPVESHSL